VLLLVAIAGKAVFRPKDMETGEPTDAMGFGDVKYMAMVGAFVGWQGVLLTVFLGALLGTLIFVPAMLAGIGVGRLRTQGKASRAGPVAQPE